MGGSAGKLYEALKNSDDEAKLKASFDSYDKDKNGVLDKKELQKFGNDCITFMKKDVKGEQFFVKLVAKGVIRGMNKKEFIDWCIDECDTNGDGEVSWDEFKSFISNHSSWTEFQITEGLDGQDVKDSAKF